MSRLISTNDVVGQTVWTRDGESLGSIEDLLLDTRAGSIAYAFVSLRNDELLAVPWPALVHMRKHGGLMLDMPNDRLARAPRFARHHRPDLTDTSWGTRLHVYYGVTPYWPS